MLGSVNVPSVSWAEYEGLKQRLMALTPVIMEKTLKAGETAVSFTVEGLNEKSRVEPYTDRWGVNPVSVSDSGNTITIEFEPQEADMVVGVEVVL